MKSLTSSGKINLRGTSSGRGGDRILRPQNPKNAGKNLQLLLLPLISDNYIYILYIYSTVSYITIRLLSLCDTLSRNTEPFHAAFPFFIFCFQSETDVKCTHLIFIRRPVWIYRVSSPAIEDSGGRPQAGTGSKAPLCPDLLHSLF